MTEPAALQADRFYARLMLIKERLVAANMVPAIGPNQILLLKNSRSRKSGFAC